MAATAYLPESYWHRLGICLACTLLCAAYVFCCRRLKPGVQRLAAASPAVACNCLVPLLFRPVTASGPAASSEILTIVLVEFAFTWLANFKVLAWAAGRGPLSVPHWNAAQFVAVQLAPITPLDATEGRGQQGAGRGRQGEHAGGAADMMLACMGKVCLVAVGLGIVSLDPPLVVLELLYTLGLYAILSFAMDGPAALFSAVIGMDVSPHFDSPWRSECLADFWSKRWDLAAGNTLRHLVYEPVLEGSLVRTQSTAQPRSTRASAAAAESHMRRRRALGAALSFLVSGAMHEVQFGYMTGRWSGGLMLAFFLAQVPLLAVERRLGAALKQRGWRVPGALRAAATLGTLLLLSHWTFWAACHRGGVTAAALASVRGVAAAGRRGAADLVHSGVSRLAAVAA